MKLLAFEAATSHLSVALWQDGELRQVAAIVENGGSEHLLPWADALLRQVGLGVRELDGLAFGAGPGGFTGIRLACGVSLGLGMALDLPIVPVCSLAALALASGEGQVLACLDARMNEVYLAAYEVDGETVREKRAPAVGRAETIGLPSEGEWFGAGDGFARYAETLRGRLGPRLKGWRAELVPTAAAVARLAASALARGEGKPAQQVELFYVRDKVALTTAERLAQGGRK